MAINEICIGWDLIIGNSFEGIREIGFLNIVCVGGGIRRKSLRLVTEEKIVAKMIEHVSENAGKVAGDGNVRILSNDGIR